MINYKHRSINIDTSNVCTLECPYCTRQHLKNINIKIPGSMLNVERFNKIVNYFNGSIVFCGQYSDPIFNTNFIDLLKICKNKRKRTIIFTAASHKNKKWYENAFKANLTAIWIFGIDGLPYESFLHRINQDGEKLYEMMKFAKKIGVRTVLWQYIVFSYNEKHIDEAKKLAEQIGVTFRLVYSSRFNSVDILKPSNKNYSLESTWSEQYGL